MKKQPMTKGRRQEMKVSLSPDTVERWETHLADNDYQEIIKRINPPTTAVNVGNYLKAAKRDTQTKVPLSIAKAITAFYKEKALAQQSLDAA